MKRHYLVFGIILGCSSLAYAQESKTVTMTGEGMAYAIPDRATVDFIVTAYDTDPSDALSSHKKAVRNVLEVLGKEKVEARNITTSDISIVPQLLGGTAKPEYAASTTLRVNSLILNTLGEFLERIVSTGVNGMSVSYYVINADSVQSLAIAEAVVDATRKATKFSETFKLKLGKLLNVKAECTKIESKQSTYEGPSNIYIISQLNKSLLVFPPRVAMKGRVEAVFEFSAKE